VISPLTLHGSFLFFKIYNLKNINTASQQIYVSYDSEEIMKISPITAIAGSLL
jgi:hypothetical protein